MQQVQRAVFDRSIIEGYRTAKTDAIAVAGQGRRLFSGTSDGSVVMYDCKLDTIGTMKVVCSTSETIRKPKERKPVLGLQNIESWRSLIGIVDGVLCAFDTQFTQNVTQIADQKGCNCFAVNEAHRTLVISNKKKLLQYAWQAPGFAFVRDFNLPDVPKSMLFVRNAVILGYRKHYECLDLVTGVANRILDVEREHSMIITEMAANLYRPATLLLSLGLQGVVLELDKVLAGTSFAYGSTTEERLEWAGLPVFCSVVLPFIVSGLPDSVEIHDLANLVSLQRIMISALGSHELSFCSTTLEASAGALATIAGPGTSAVPQQQLGFVCNGEELSLLRMIPIAKQVDELAARGQYEEAITLHSMCATDAPEYVRGIDIGRLHSTAADALRVKGDFDKAIKHYIDGATEFVSVIRFFPDFVPQSLHPMLGIQSNDTPNLSGAVLQRAATAVVHFCDFHRPKVIRRAVRAEQLKELGILDSSVGSLSSNNSAGLYHSGALGKGAAGTSGLPAAAGVAVGSGDDDDEYITDPDEEIRRAQLLDTVLLFALVSCNPPRRNATVQLLSSGNNYCQVETCSVLLASQGNPFTEALLWLYRSHSLHSRVLDALKEEKSVAVGGWNRDQFYLWSADYLRWLWYHEIDATLPKMALFALRPLLEYDAELGLSVLLCRPATPAAASATSIASLSKTSFGGRGLTISEVIAFLRTIRPQPVVRKSVPFGASATAAAGTGGAALSATAAAGSTYSKYAALQGSAVLQAVVAGTPLLTGHALGVAFLECIISSGDAPAALHDEFVQSLVDGLSARARSSTAASAATVDSADPATEVSEGDAELLRSIYRRKLQTFLLASVDYNPQRALKLLQPAAAFHREQALVESRLGEHESVLVTYVHRLRDMRLAEWYCDRIYSAYLLSNNGATTGASSRSTSGNDHRTSFSGALTAAAGPAGGADANAGAGAANPNGLGMNALVKRDDGVVSGLRDGGEVYLTLFKVLLMDGHEVRGWLQDDDAHLSSPRSDVAGLENNADGDTGAHAAEERLSGDAAVDVVIALAEKYFDRVDAAQMLEILPENTPIASLLRYFSIVLEYGAAQKRNMQIIHQLLRIREVQIRTNN